MSKLRFRYQTIEFGSQDIHVRSLRDRQEFSDDDGVAEALGIPDARWSLFGVLWDSGHVLAHFMSRYHVGTRSILEMGSGLALPSLLLNRRGYNVTATDRHPEAGAFLTVNTELNQDPPIPFHRVSWSDEIDEIDDFGTFDLIIASDVLYESEHAQEVTGFMLRHAAETCEFIMVDAARGERRNFDQIMAEAGFAHDELKVLEDDYPGKKFKGRIHRYQRGEHPNNP